MNWYPQSPIAWSGSDKLQPLPCDLSPSEALSTAKSNITLLFSLLTDPTYISSPKPLKSSLSHQDYEKVNKCISESLKALNKLALEFNILTPNYFSPLVLKTDEQDVSEKVKIESFQKFKDEIHPFVEQKVFKSGVDDSCLGIGISFETLEEAAEVFEQYAVRCGFNICKGNSKRDVYQEFACSARGKVRMRKVDDMAKQRNRKSIKKMCKCHIILRKKEGLWVITTRKLYHTHELLTPEQIKKTAKNRFIPEEHKIKAIELYKQGEAPAKIQLDFETHLKEKCTWSMKDLYNMLYRYRPE